MFNSNDRIELILESINIIEERMHKIKTDEDFVSSTDGLTIPDAITMRLQTIGENFNIVFKENPSLIEDTLKIGILPIIGSRNIISDHHGLSDYQIMSGLCTEQPNPLKQDIAA